MPCATQNELTLADAEALYSAGCGLVVEGANMPCTPDAINLFMEKGVGYGPAKAANAGEKQYCNLEFKKIMKGRWRKDAFLCMLTLRVLFLGISFWVG